MAEYDITSPNGETFTITAPEGATEEQVLAYAKSQFANKQPEQAPAPEMTPEFQQRIAQPQGAIEEAKTLKEEHLFDPEMVKLATLAGTVLGGTYGALGKAGAGLVRGAIGGATEGALSGTAGEMVRSGSRQGDVGNEMLAIGAELASPAAIRVIPEVLRSIPKGATSLYHAVMPYSSAKVVQAGQEGTKGSLSSIEKATRQEIFGKTTPLTAQESDKYTLQYFADASENLTQNYGLKLTGNELPNKALRTNIESIVAKAPVSFKDSQAGRELLQELATIKSITPAQKTAIRNLLLEQTSTAPIDKTNFAKRLHNTLQGTTDFEKEGVELGEAGKEVLKARYNQYLASLPNNKLGSQPLTFDLLNKIETEGYTAKARDGIPALIKGGLKKDEKSLETIFKNIERSPEGKKDLTNALVGYFKELPEDRILKEYDRLKPIIAKSKIMPFEDLMRMQRNVATIANKTLGGKTVDVAKVAVRDAILGGLLPNAPATAKNLFGEPVKPENPVLPF